MRARKVVVVVFFKSQFYKLNHIKYRVLNVDDKKLAGLNLIQAVCKYNEIYETIFGKHEVLLNKNINEKYYPFLKRPSDEIISKFGLNKTLGEFLKHNELDSLLALFMYGQFGQGYGTINTVPAI